jgi:hypothetical protein
MRSHNPQFRLFAPMTPYCTPPAIPRRSGAARRLGGRTACVTSSPAWAQLGRIKEAQEPLAALKRMDANLEFSASMFRRNWPNPADVDHLLDGLRKAGFD